MRFSTLLAIAIVAIVAVELAEKMPAPATDSGPSPGDACPLEGTDRAHCADEIAHTVGAMTGYELQCAGPSPRVGRFSDKVDMLLAKWSLTDKQRVAAQASYKSTMQLVEMLPRRDASECSTAMATFDSLANRLGAD